MQINISEEEEKYLLAVGFPTFDEFQKNPGKWKIRPDQVMAIMQDGATIARNQIRRHVYIVDGHKTESLHKVEQIAKDLGWDMRFMDFKPEFRQAGAGKYDLEITVIHKDWMRPTRGNEENQGRQQEGTEALD